MSGSRRNTATVSREYNASAEHCTRALELLLKKSVNKEGAPASAPDAAKEIKSVRDNTSIHK
jgi:hypothetical protein